MGVSYCTSSFPSEQLGEHLMTYGDEIKHDHCVYRSYARLKRSLEFFVVLRDSLLCTLETGDAKTKHKNCCHKFNPLEKEYHRHCNTAGTTKHKTEQQPTTRRHNENYPTIHEMFLETKED